MSFTTPFTSCTFCMPACSRSPRGRGRDVLHDAVHQLHLLHAGLLPLVAHLDDGPARDLRDLHCVVVAPHPDCATLETTILDALHLMHDGRYLHLPILDNKGKVVALVDVLELTYGVVNQMGSVQTS